MCKRLLILILLFPLLICAGPVFGSQVEAAQPYSQAPVGSKLVPPDQNTAIYMPDKEQYTFTYQGKDSHIQYVISARDPLIRRGLISLRVIVDKTKPLFPLRETGLYIRSATGELIDPGVIARSGQSSLVSHELKGSHAHFSFQDIWLGKRLQKQYDIFIQGETLVFHVVSNTVAGATTGYISFNFDQSRSTPSPKILNLPTSPYPVVGLEDGIFMSTYADPFLSSLGRYDISEMVEHDRCVHAANTPAWLVEDASGTYPPLDVTAYLTISKRLINVAPSSPPQNDPYAKSIRSQPLFDPGQIPLAHRPYESLKITRGWEAQETGSVELKGLFSLKNGQTAVCNVRLLENETGEEHVLFSQILDRTTKTKTGIEGTFPLQQGDQLLFDVNAPAVMDGGEVLFHVIIDGEEYRYDSIEDFTNEQGAYGWFYEQQKGEEYTLFVWNPERGRWESPNTRSYQTASQMVCRAGRMGNAFQSAELFFDELRAMGIGPLTLFLKDWSRHARLTVPPSNDEMERYWGSIESLKTVTKREQTQGNLIAQNISFDPERYEIVKQAPANPILWTTMTAPPTYTAQSRILSHITKEEIASARNKMNFNALVLEDFPILEPGSPMFILTDKKTPDEWSSSSALRQAARFLDSLKSEVNGPVLLWGKAGKRRYDTLLAGFVTGLIAPIDRGANFSETIDEEIKLARTTQTRAGFGTYGEFFLKAKDARVDLRMNPFDYYLTSTVSFARVPYLSLAIQFPSMSDRDIRKHLLETYCLLQPPSLEYLDDGNAVRNIIYYSLAGKQYSAESMLLDPNSVETPRVKIQYANGLEIYANQCAIPWGINHPAVPNIDIEKDGFLATNEKTGLLSVIGQKGARPFTAARTKDSFFLHSRGAVLMGIPPLRDGWDDANVGIYDRRRTELRLRWSNRSSLAGRFIPCRAIQ